MSKLVAALAVLVLLASSAAASIMKIDLTKATQTTSPLKYTVDVATTHGMLVIDVKIPRKQTPLEHLWRIDLVLRKGDASTLTAPLETKLVNDVLEVQLIVDPAAIKGTYIWIRTGKHAPLAETVYALDVASFAPQSRR